MLGVFMLSLSHLSIYLYVEINPFFNSSKLLLCLLTLLVKTLYSVQQCFGRASC